jgi:menaquinone-dependent protoporphyrinogen oxidase
MKTCIIYRSKYGYTKECAQQISAVLGTEAELIEVKQANRMKSFSDIDLMIIGSAVYAGSTPRIMRSFCKKHEQSLLNIPHLGLFLCGTDPDRVDLNFQKSFSSSLLQKAEVTEWFGGRLVLAQFSGIMHAVLKKMLHGETEVHAEKPEAVQRFATRVQELVPASM